MADLLFLACPFLALACGALAHVLLMRLCRSGVIFGAFAGVLAALGLTAGLSAAGLESSGAGAGDLLANVLLSAVLGYGYLHFVNLGSTARRLRLLHELEGAPGGLTETEILARYNGAEVVARRVERLVSSGQVDFDGRRYRPNPSAMRLAAVCFMALKRLIYGKGHGPF